jgi:Putative 2OG-Fe(II) oxygenase
LQNDHSCDDWFDPGVVVRTFDLPAPAGYRDNLEFQAALRAVLYALHRQKNHPLDQSLRHGTQTSRNLLVRPAPEIAQLLGSFETALAAYQQEVGSRIAAGRSGAEPHPLLARSHSPASIVGCWSVCLRRRGFHVNHIHPEGWLSSAYYVDVPAEVHGATDRAGWLKFGEPRFPVDGLDAVGFVEPVPGRLVLFPSYLWHGTNPLSGAEPRLSVAFDALPRSEIL